MTSDRVDSEEACGHSPEQDARDAARYRWLRDKPDDVPAVGLDVAFWEACTGEACRGDALDAAVDAEMQSGQQGRMQAAEATRPDQQEDAA